jgi:hypothetical protein
MEAFTVGSYRTSAFARMMLDCWGVTAPVERAPRSQNIRFSPPPQTLAGSVGYRVQSVVVTG